MKYQIGDMLKVYNPEGDALCVIIEARKDKSFGVFWVIESSYIRNTPGYKYWSEKIFDHEFVRLS